MNKTRIFQMNALDSINEKVPDLKNECLILERNSIPLDPC